MRHRATVLVNRRDQAARERRRVTCRTLRSNRSADRWVILPAVPDYYDSDGTRLGVEPPTSSRPSIRVLARSDALACRVDLTASGADYLGRLLVSTAAAVVAALDQDEQDEDAGPATP